MKSKVSDLFSILQTFCFITTVPCFPYLPGGSGLNMVFQEFIFVFIQCIDRFGIADLSEIVDIRQSVDVFQNVERTLHLFLPPQFEDLAFRVFYVAESDRIRWTSLLARCFHGAVPHRVTFFFGV